MAIAFSCPSCDRTYTVGDVYAGKVTSCKDCSTRMVVPDAAGEPEPPPPPTGPRARVVAVSPPTAAPAPPRGPSRREEAEAGEAAGDAPRSRNAAAADAARFIEEAAKKQRRRERKAEARKSEPTLGISFSPTILTGLGGAGLMALAVVWYAVAASQFETVNVRGPFVLLVAGFIGLLKGVLGHED